MNLNKDFSVYYHGVPIKPTYRGRSYNWKTIIKMLKYLHGDYLEIDGWRFNISYGLIYLRERKGWGLYLPPDGVKNKLILDVGGGCGETAKFLLEHGAFRVDIIESNKECEKSLKYNRIYHPITYKIKKFDLSDISKDKYDLIKIDIEGYESELIPCLDWIKKDIVLETHSQYITDKFMENGFNYCRPIDERDKEIYGGVYQLCRWIK